MTAKREVHGVLALDKPVGPSSNAILQKVKRLFAAAKAGHTGSLDPAASGLLPVCFGRATRFAEFLLGADKSYEFTVVFGTATDSGDAEGAVIASADAGFLRADAVDAALTEFRGAIDQVPPMHSALKRDGVPLYKLARRGLEVERPPRRVHVHRFEMLAFRAGARAEADFRVDCGKGVYIRALAMDLGRRLGCGAHIRRLRRTRCGVCGIEQASAIEQLEAAAGDFETLDAKLISPSEAMAHLPVVELAEPLGRKWCQGQIVPAQAASGLVRVRLADGRFAGIGEIGVDSQLQPRRVATPH